MATTTTTTIARKTSAKAETDKAEAVAIAVLKDQFETAHKAYDEADAKAKSFLHQRAVAAVEMARVAYRTATHPAIATPRYDYNITGAAKALGIPVATLRPYALAGKALGKKDRAGLLSAPNAEDIALVEASFDATSRADQKEKRVKAAAKKAALEAKVAALEAKNGTTTTAPATAPATGDTAPASTTAPATDTAPATAAPAAATAPATAPANAGPSVAEDVMSTARTLVRQVKALRVSKEWSGVAKEVVAILAEAFPVLSK